MPVLSSLVQFQGQFHSTFTAHKEPWFEVKHTFLEINKRWQRRIFLGTLDTKLTI